MGYTITTRAVIYQRLGAYSHLILCVGGIFVSCSLWALGSKGSNEGQQHTGKRGLIVCVTAAFIIGALPQIFSFYDGAAHKVDDNKVTAAN